MYGFIIVNDQNSLVFVECDVELREHLAEKQQEYMPDVSSSGFGSEQMPTPENSRDEEEELLFAPQTETKISQISRKQSLKTTGFCTGSRKNSTTVKSSGSGISEPTRKEERPLDYNALTHFFLPLVILWRTKQEFDRDPYSDFSEFGGFRFDFRGLRDQYVLIGISHGARHESWKVLKYLESVCAILDFCFGSLLPMISGNNSVVESRAYKRLFVKFLGKICNQTPRTDGSLQWVANSVDIGALLDSSQGAIAQTLSTLGREFQVYLGSSVTLLVSNHTLISLQQSLVDVDFEANTRPKVTVLMAKDTLLLLQLCPNICEGRRLPSNPKHYQVWLREPAGFVSPWDEGNPVSIRRREVSQRYQWDVFRFEILPGTHLVCLGRSLGSDIVAKISFALDIFEILEDEVEDIEGLLELLDKTLAQICQSLIDMIPDEIASGNSGGLLQNLHRTANGLNAQWSRLRQNFTDALTEAKKHPVVYPGAQKPQSIVQRQNFFLNSVYSAYSAGIDAQVSALSSQLRSLMFQLVQKGQESAKGYKLEMFEKCWARLNASKLYQSQTRSLLSMIKSNEFRSLRPAELGLDMMGYLFVCPKKRVCYSHMTANLDRESDFGDEVIHLLSQHCQNRAEIVQPRASSINADMDFLLIKVGNLHKFYDVVTSPKRRRADFIAGPSGSVEISKKSPRGTLGDKTTKIFNFDTLLRKFKKLNVETAYFSSIAEPVWCLAVFEPFVHKNLAVQQTKRLTVLLHERTSGIGWNFG